MLNSDANRQAIPRVRQSDGRRTWLVCMVATWSALIVAVSAEDAKKPTARSTEEPVESQFEVTATVEKLGAKVVFQRIQIAGSTHHISVLTPEGYQPHSVPEQRRIVMVGPTPGTYISLQWIEKVEDVKEAVAPESLRAAVRVRYRGAQIVDEFPVWAGGREGLGVEAHWLPDGSVPMGARVLFIPVGDGRVEVTCVAPRQALASCEASLTQVTLSFRSAPLGEPLDVPALSPKI